MDYPKHLYRHPGPYGAGDQSYGVIGARDAEHEEVLRSQGWGVSKDAGLDSEDAETDKPKLRAEYQELSGKRAFPGWDADVLREKIAALKEAK